MISRVTKRAGTKCSGSHIRYYMTVGDQDFGLAGGLPLRYARDLRPLTAIPLNAIPASLHTPLRGTPPLCPPFFLRRWYPGSAKLVLGRPASTFPNI